MLIESRSVEQTKNMLNKVRIPTLLDGIINSKYYTTKNVYELAEFMFAHGYAIVKKDDHVWVDMRNVHSSIAMAMKYGYMDDVKPRFLFSKKLEG